MSPPAREVKTRAESSVALRVIEALCLLIFCVLLVLAGVVGMTWPEQACFGALVLAAGVWMDRRSNSYLVTLALVLVSCFSTFRYGFWRAASVIRLCGHGNGCTALDLFFVWMLLLAEGYSFVVLALGYLQMLWPLRRAPVPLPDQVELWPEVDLLIPTYDEPLHLVKYTALAALNIDWPADRLHVYILDDGRREEFRSFCAEAGIGYMTRENNQHAKAGNINHALQRLRAPFVAVFDSDHVPTRSFLQLTMGWFDRDPKLALLQTPHHFYSPDPFERNLKQFRVVPNEGELFYGVVQDGNDFWNATFFCGSCAVMRRAALDDVGGIAVETVTEDAHTSLRMQMKGWNTAYINIPQAAGLATERLSGHVRQRIRWARGMVQVLRLENPLFARGLSLAQRLCYFNAMSHFLYALPRLIFLTAPLIYLIFGKVNIPGYWAAVLAYAVPHLVLAYVTNSRIQGQHRHSFWNEIYETVLAPYILFPTLKALVNPALGRFHVTPKGGVVDRGFFDARIARPFLLLLLLNVLGLLCAVPRLIALPHVRGVSGLFGWMLNVPASVYDGGHAGTVWVNVVWTVFNLIVLSVAIAVARESQQRRQTVRVSMTVPAGVVLPDGSVLQGATTDVSSGGVMVRSHRPVNARPGDPVSLVFPVLDGRATLPATVIAADGCVLRAHFDQLTLPEEEALTMVLYSRADTWLGWDEEREVDDPLVSIWRIAGLAVAGFMETARSLAGVRRRALKNGILNGGTTAATLALLLGCLGAVKAAGQTAVASGAAQFAQTLSMADLRVPDGVVLRGPGAVHTVRFAVPETEVVNSAEMALQLRPSPAMAGKGGQLAVKLNGAAVAVVPLDARAAPGVSVARGADGLIMATVRIPPELIVHANELTFASIVPGVAGCGDTNGGSYWIKIDDGSSVSLGGTEFALRDDLALLPLPFLEGSAGKKPAEVHVAFLQQPSAKALEAAGIVASWVGMLRGDRPLNVSVSVGQLPQENAIVLAERASDLPAEVQVAAAEGAVIALRSHPHAPGAKLLVLAGADGDQLLAAARALVMRPRELSGVTVQVRGDQRVAPRELDDAPRWQAAGRSAEFEGVLNEGDNSMPTEVYFRLPPDLYFGTRQSVPLRLQYRYSGPALTRDSALGLTMNGEPIGAVPLPQGGGTLQEMTTVVDVPVGSLRPFSNTLQGRFVLHAASAASCAGAEGSPPSGAILGGSFPDPGEFAHWVKLPNLELFANAGYPFTRRADLSDTAVMLPRQPALEVMELYLEMMEHFGAQTGYPAVNVTVTDAAGLEMAKDKLVLGTFADVPGLSSLHAQLPARLEVSGLHANDRGGMFSSFRALWAKLTRRNAGTADLPDDLPEPAAVIEGAEWKRHSVVLIAVRDGGVAPGFVGAFRRVAQSSEIAGSVSVFDGSGFESYGARGATYSVGTLPRWERWGMAVAAYPWAMAVGVLACCLGMAAVMRGSLRRRARRRLQALA